MTMFDRNGEAPVALSDLAAERNLIAVALADNRIVERLALAPEAFADSSHRELWAALRSISDRGEAVSVAVLAVTLPRLQGYIARLPDMGARIDLADSYAGIVRDFATRRCLVELVERVQNAAGDMTKPAQEITGDAMRALGKLDLGRPGDSKRTIARRVYDSLSASLEVFPTGLAGLDTAMSGGLVAGQLYGIGARKKVGKTILLGTVSHNLNAARITHLFVSAEMSPVQIEQRNIAREMGFNSVKFLRADREDLRRRVGDYVANTANHTLYEHAPGCSFAELRGIVARARLKGVKGVIVDYLQIIEGKEKGETEESHHRRVAQWLANMGRDTGLWVLVAAQLNQDDNVRGGEGLKLACDMYFVLHREKDHPGAWLEMQESRHTLYANVGSETEPGLWLRKNGPYFSDETPRDDEFPRSGAAA